MRWVHCATHLLEHLDEEERLGLPLAAEYLSAEEWGRLPGHGLAAFDGDKVWLILGLIRERMNEDQRAAMLAHMPPPAVDMWTGFGEQAFNELAAAGRGGGGEPGTLRWPVRVRRGVPGRRQPCGSVARTMTDEPEHGSEVDEVGRPRSVRGRGLRRPRGRGERSRWCLDGRRRPPVGRRRGERPGQDHGTDVGGRTPARATGDVPGRGRGAGDRAPPRGPGGDGHGQVAGLPGAGRAQRQEGRRGHGDQGAAGPAGRQGPAAARGRPGPAGAARLRRAQGPQQLPVPAAGARGGLRRGATRAR